MSIAKRFFQPTGAVAFEELLRGLEACDINYRLSDALSDKDRQACMIGDIAGLDVEDNNGALRLTYMKSVKDKAALADTKAVGMALVPWALPPSEQQPFWVAVDNPEYAFAHLSRRLYSPEGQEDAIISSAPGDKSPIDPIANSAVIGKNGSIGYAVVIGDNVSIGDNVHIAAHSVIGDGVVIGDDVSIGAHCMLRCCSVGSRSRILSGTIIGECGFGLALSPNKPPLAPPLTLPHIAGVRLGKNVEIGANCTIDRGKFADTIIGDDVKLDNMVHIAHNVVIGAATVIAGQSGVAGSCIIGKAVMVGGSVAISDGLKIGDGAIIAGGSGVTTDVAAGITVMGTPAQPFAEFGRSWAKFKQLGKRQKDDER